MLKLMKEMFRDGLEPFREGAMEHVDTIRFLVTGDDKPKPKKPPKSSRNSNR